eukprot:scaffold718_cov252-Pinguiococcus_pyrenoidosus.AAC.2
MTLTRRSRRRLRATCSDCDVTKRTPFESQPGRAGQKNDDGTVHGADGNTGGTAQRLAEQSTDDGAK